jgi:tetratricopeptide (TPR) repeat protein
MGRYADSIAASERSIELRPNRDAYANLAAVYFSERRFPEAVEYSKLSLKLDPSDALNWGVLGDALYWTPGRRGEAADAYHKAIVLFNSKINVNPRDSENLGFVAVYSAMVDDNRSAMNNLERALAVAPKDAAVMFKAAFVYSHLGDKDQALTWLKKALEAGYPKSAVRDTPEFDHLLTDPQFKRLVGDN